MNKAGILIALAAAFQTAFVHPAAAHAENWAGWRGPSRNAVSPEKNIPTTWSEDEGVRWRSPLPGAGISSPVIWGDRVFVTSSDGPRQDDLHVICLSRRDGSELWHQRLWGTSPTRYHASKSSMASPTAVTDGKQLFAFFGTGDLFCFDIDGQLVWHRSLASEYGRFENRFSATSSPLLYGDKVIVQCDHYGDSYAVAVDQKTGADRWRVERPDEWLSWSSPQITRVDDTGRYELLLCGSLKIDGIDPETGSKLWTVGGLQQECIPTPVLGHGLIYAVSGPGGRSLAIRPGGRGDVSDSHVVWENTRGVPFVPSAILVGDLYYLIDDDGIATCLDAHDGKRVWQKRLPGRYTASPIATGEHIYFCNEDGETIVIRAGRKKYEQVSRNRLDRPVFASPAISQGNVFIRTTDELLCLGSN
jgi:outer membrane protein assembly factor BamB